MITFNELSRATGYEVLGDDNLYIAENLDLEEKVVAHMMVGDGVHIEKDESLGLDDCSICTDLGVY